MFAAKHRVPLSLLGIIVVTSWLATSPTVRAADGASAEKPQAKALRVLILAGEGRGNLQTTTPFLRRVLAGTGRFDMRVCEAPAGLTAGTLAGFDVVIADASGAALGSETEKAVCDFVASGKGLLITSAALASAKTDWPELGKAIKVSGKPAAVEFVEVKLDQPEHPIVKGMAGKFKLADGLHRGLAAGPDADVIATSAEGDAVLFTSRFGKGRVVYSAMGRDLAAMQATEFITTFARGIEWAAGAEVTLPANLALPQPKADAVRTLLITGGHDHEVTFYSTFDGYRDLTWTPVASSATAFAKDFRDKYDVLILYDFSRDLDETSKKNLRDFVESGKGVVVVHHALLNYQAWTWWIDEVVGGSYRLAPSPRGPTSTIKADQQMFITPKAHPITAGIAPFQLTDETYKRMWIAPGVQPLLTTDNPDSDPVIAWISPYAKSRVVYIQLGHGRNAFFHPSFRALVHNSILWSAKRLGDDHDAH